jgi:hypothetical protein
MGRIARLGGVHQLGSLFAQPRTEQVSTTVFPPAGLSTSSFSAAAYERTALFNTPSFRCPVLFLYSVFEIYSGIFVSNCYTEPSIKIILWVGAPSSAIITWHFYKFCRVFQV